MTKTKHSLLMSVIALLLCFSMLIGTTFAWFTDSVTSSGNKIESGTLKLDLEVLDKISGTWSSIKDEEKALFNYDKWEPGYTDVKVLKIENEGTLALKWYAQFVSRYQLTALADVIDVYVKSGEEAISYPATRDFVAEGYTRVGTVKDFVNTIETTTKGELLAGNSAYLAIALKMQEEAGNEYQGMNLVEGGSEEVFDIKIFATQLTAESDSFDENYDENANFGETPAAKVTVLNSNSTISVNKGEGEPSVEVLGKNLFVKANGTLRWGTLIPSINLDTAYQFQPNLSYEEAQESPYRYYHADFIVKTDKEVPADSVAVLGYYDAWCQYNGDHWVALTSPDPIPENFEIRLVQLLGNGSITVSLEDLALFGNDGIGFLCGAVDLTGENAGTTLTVELRLYETEEPSSENGNSHNKETGDYITVATYDYTFTDKGYRKELVDVNGVNVSLTEDSAKSIEYNVNDPSTVNSIEVYTASDLVAVQALIENNAMKFNGGNDISAKIIFKNNIDFGGADWTPLPKDFYVIGNGYTLSNVNFLANENGQAGLFGYAGNVKVEGLTLKNITVAGSQAGAFAGNADNVILSDCALEGNVTVNWSKTADPYNGVASVFGVTSGGTISIDVDTTNANIVINRGAITYPEGTTPETNDIVGVRYNGSSYTIVE